MHTKQESALLITAFRLQLQHSGLSASRHSRSFDSVLEQGEQRIAHRWNPGPLTSAINNIGHIFVEVALRRSDGPGLGRVPHESRNDQILTPSARWEQGLDCGRIEVRLKS